MRFGAPGHGASPASFSGEARTMSQTRDSDDGHSLLKRALRSILLPLARLAVVRGLPLSALNQILKEVMVEAAAAELVRRGDKTTQSRLSVLSGVHRKDIRAFHNNPAEPGLDRHVVSQPETLIGRWLGDPAYCDAAGRPRELPRTGPAPSFEALAESISTDVRPRTLLEELKRLGFVDHDPVGDIVRLSAGAFVPNVGEAAKLGLFEANIADHVTAASQNVLGRGPFLERAVYYTHVPKSAVDALEQRARTDSGALLEALNAQALRNQARGDHDIAEEELQRFRFGVYFYREDMAQPDPDAQTDQAGQDDSRDADDTSAHGDEGGDGT